MGFGKKTDYSTGKVFDLDKTYKNIIQPAVIGSGLQCVRADEIQDSGLIDKSMYALLMNADLVIADISTFNPNAIYELGIRHAVRPFSTIVIKEEDGKIPFDLDHTRTFKYKHMGDDIGVDEAKRCQEELSGMIKHVISNPIVDSPLYEFINDIQHPQLSSEEYNKIIGDLAKKENQIFAWVETATDFMRKGEFVEAASMWNKASNAIPGEEYYIQQQTLATYKSKHPTEKSSLSDALGIINKLITDGAPNDPETQGLLGAIYKRMWFVYGDVEYLKRSSEAYAKGFELNSDYYTGENFALCQDMLAEVEEDEDEKIYYMISAKRSRIKIIKVLNDVEELVNDGEFSQDFKWHYATLSNCYYGIGDDDLGEKFEKLFTSFAVADWEIETFNESKQKLFDLVRQDNNEES